MARIPPGPLSSCARVRTGLGRGAGVGQGQWGVTIPSLSVDNQWDNLSNSLGNALLNPPGEDPKEILGSRANAN